MNLLITGGLGYVGQRLAEYAATLGHDLTLTSRRPPAREAWPWRVVNVDPTDANTLQAACAGIDAIVHLAGMNAAECARQSTRAVDSRRAAACALVKAATGAGVRRVVLVSSVHVYGRALTGVIDEHTPPEPTHPYGFSHLAAEQEIQRAREVDPVVVRLTNAFGAPVDANCDCWTLLTNDLARQAVREGGMRLASSGRQRRDFIALSEVCRALLHICTMTSVHDDRLMNLGSRESRTLAEQAGRVAAAYQRALGVRPLVTFGTSDDAAGSGPLEVRCDRLAASGFEWRAGADDAELDGLIRFCERTVQAA